MCWSESNGVESMTDHYAPRFRDNPRHGSTRKKGARFRLVTVRDAVSPVLENRPMRYCICVRNASRQMSAAISDGSGPKRRGGAAINMPGHTSTESGTARTHPKSVRSALRGNTSIAGNLLDLDRRGHAHMSNIEGPHSFMERRCLA